MLRNRLRLAGLLVAAMFWASTAQAQFALTPVGTSGPPTGGAEQIGTGLPLPALAGIFFGGTSMATAGTPFWPPLGIPANTMFTGMTPTSTIMQNLSTANGGVVSIPAGALSLAADGIANQIAVFPTNAAVFQVGTTISFAWPSASATFAPGGGPGPAAFTGPPLGGGSIMYAGTANSFGGAAQFAITPGPGSGLGAVPLGTMGTPPIASVWLNIGAGAPTTVASVGVAGASNALGVGAQGAATTVLPATTMFGVGLTTPTGTMTTPVGFAGNVRAVNVPVGGIGCTMFCVGPIGTVPSSLPVATGPITNMVTSTQGFPWTTGLITVSQPAAVGGAEIFFLSGTDMRVSGVGNLSMVSGALSARMLSGPNSNRAWVSLNLVPEPTTALGAAGALGVLALCHTLVRRRSR